MRFQPGMIPPEMRALRQWVVWRTVQREDKDTKPLYCPRTGELARTQDQAGKTYKDRPEDTWSTFEEALACVHKGKGTWEGTGFVFTADDPFCGIDLDDCRAANGALNAQAKEIGRQLKSYTEVSPSGSGLHIIVRAVLPAGGNRRGDLEMYDRGRYFTITGNVVPGASSVIEDRQAEVDELHRSLFAPPNGNGKRPGCLTLSDAELLEKARKAVNGGSFQALYDHGLVAMYDGDDSRADLALCGHLAFWAQGEEARVDRMFRGSALYRAKWDRADYSQRTIRKALSGKSEFYTPNGSHANGHSNGHGHTAEPQTEEAQKAAEEALRPTESGSADRVLSEYADILRHDYAADMWWKWGGSRWHENAEGTVLHLIETNLRAIYDEARDTSDDERRKALGKYALRTESHRYMRSVLGIMRTRPVVEALTSDFDSNPFLLNCRNGTVDLKTGELLPHRKEDLLTKLAGCEYDPSAVCPLWEQFLARILPDDDVRAFLQRACGYALTGDVSEQCFFFLYGQGANGKSVLLSTLLYVIGEYADSLRSDLLMAKPGDHVHSDIATLLNKRLVVTVELDKGRKVAEGLIKQMTGGDQLVGRHLYKETVKFRPTHKIFLAANHRPTVTGTDLAMWRRVMLMPFDVTIPEGEQDRRLTEKLQAEASGILRWCVEGYAAMLESGLNPPQAVRAALEEYRRDEDVIGRFIFEACELGDPRTHTEETSELFEAYKLWCARNGETAENLHNFGRSLSDRGYPKRIGKGARKYRDGLRLLGSTLIE